MKFAFNTICLKEILNIYLEELHVINYYVKNHLMLLKNKKYDGNQRELASVAYKCFHKKCSGGAIENRIMANQQLAEGLYKPIIRKFEK